MEKKEVNRVATIVNKHLLGRKIDEGSDMYGIARDIIEDIEQELDKAREEGREELLDSIVVGIEQLKSIVTMFNPMSTEIRAKQSGEIEAYDGLLEKLSKLKDNK